MRTQSFDMRGWDITMNLTQRTDHSGPKNLELGRGVKKWSPKRSHQTRWVCALDSELPHEEHRRGGNSILSAQVHASSQKRGRAYTDKFQRVHNSVDLNWTHDTNTPHRPETNGIAERACRRAKEGTATEMEQSGLPAEWWNVTATCGTCTIRWPMARQPCEKI